jgi:hypothetical protein
VHSAESCKGVSLSWESEEAMPSGRTPSLGSDGKRSGSPCESPLVARCGYPCGGAEYASSVEFRSVHSIYVVVFVEECNLLARVGRCVQHVVPPPPGRVLLSRISLRSVPV